MTMTMIEQVARALCWEAMFSPGSTHTRTRDQMVEEGWKYYTDDARVAIRAMREPTEGMAKAGNSNLLGGLMWTPEGMKLAERTFQAMIDVALEEGE